MNSRVLIPFLSLVVPILAQSGNAPTAQEIIDQIKSHVGVPWRAETVDTFKAGDPQTRVTGIATTMMATYDVLRRAAAQSKNLVITHEPTFYSHLDKTAEFESAHDPVWAEKDKFIREHHMVVWRFHDHWHMRTPDGIMEGVLAKLGWARTYDAATGIARLPETRLDQLATEVEKKLGAKVLRVVGRPEMRVSTVALEPGAGGPAGHLRALRRDDVDVLLIGEVPEWETVEYVSDAVAEGKRKALLMVGHIPSEQPGMETCAEWLKTFVKDVPVSFVPAIEPFWTPR